MFHVVRVYIYIDRDDNPERIEDVFSKLQLAKEQCSTMAPSCFPRGVGERGESGREPASSFSFRIYIRSLFSILFFTTLIKVEIFSFRSGH